MHLPTQKNASPRARRRLAPTLLGATSLLAFAAGGAVVEFTPVRQAHAQAIQPQGPSERLPDFSSLAKQVKPAVVSITSIIKDGGGEDADDQGGGEGGGGNGGQMPFPFPFPFGMMPQQQQHRTMEAKGSGFIIDANGTIVTNNHVVKGASSITVTLSDGTTLPAKVVGTDPRTDIAVLKVRSPNKLPFIQLGNSDDVEPGQWVVAVGNPFGLGGTVTAGIVSARGRDIGEGNYDNFIQIDAPINRGNSGGPLFTQDGKVVGVNTAILSPSGGSIGIGFAIPSNLVKNIVDQIETTGHVTRGYLGVEAQPVTAAMAKALNMPAGSGDERGALIASIQDNSPASHSTLKPGDVIVGVNGQHVGSPRELAIDIAQIKPNSDAHVDYVRDGKPSTTDVTIAKLGSAQTRSAQQAQQSFGLTMAPLTSDLRQQLGLDETIRGAVVKEVTPGSQADQAGLQAGDVIVAVGNESISSPAQAGAALRKAMQSNSTVAMRIMRDGQMLFVAVTPPASNGGGDNGSGGDNGGSDDGNG
jgi:serine protease Do